MSLSTDLISQFVKVTKDEKKEKKETIVYGKAVIDNDGNAFVQIDGSDQYTPATTTSNITSMKPTDGKTGVGEYVAVMIKDHSAVIIGNTEKPSATNESVQAINLDLSDKVTTKQLEAETAKIYDRLDAGEAAIGELETDKASIKQLETEQARITDLEADKLDVTVAEATYAKAKDLEATNATINNLDATYAKVESLNSINATLNNLGVTYANIDFSNIGRAAMEYFYSNSGLIENVTISDGTITGHLVGVTIKGDIIEAGTLIADKLVMLGEDGLYYKLNTNGSTTEIEQTEYNSINGSIITAKSITATQISVDDLVAFDATIGGFNITDKSIYSEVKDSDGNTVRGVYMDTDGQVNFGDDSNYIRYYRDENGSYHMVISAETILYNIDGKQKSLADLGIIGEYVKIGTYEGEPCIELGELDSEFKLVITNTRIMFMEGTNVPAYISNQSLFIKKAVIEEELQQGGFVWKIRSNGNLGLMWKGVND